MNSSRQLILGLVGTVVLLIIGLYLSLGKGGFLLAGYNTAPGEEKKTWDGPALCKFMGKVLICLSPSCLVIGFAKAMEIDWLEKVIGILIILFVVGVVCYVNTGNRFKRIPKP